MQHKITSMPLSWNVLLILNDTKQSSQVEKRRDTLEGPPVKVNFSTVRYIYINKALKRRLKLTQMLADL